MGVVGLETAFPVLYTELVKTGVLSMAKLIELLHDAPCRRFGIEENEADFTLFDLEEKYTVDPEEFVTLGRATPFAGREVYGRCRMTVANGEIVWREER